MVLKFHLLLLCIVCSGAVEQILWTMVKEMNDINSNLHVVHQRENTRCLECGTRAKMMNGKAFSCHNGDQLCSVHYKCPLKFNLLTGTWITEVGWRHFCNSKGTFKRSVNSFWKFYLLFMSFLNVFADRVFLWLPPFE